MGSKAYHLLANALRSSDKMIYGAAAMNHASKLLRGNVVTGIATTLVLSTADFIDYLMDEFQVLKYSKMLQKLVQV